MHRDYFLRRIHIWLYWNRLLSVPRDASRFYPRVSINLVNRAASSVRPERELQRRACGAGKRWSTITKGIIALLLRCLSRLGFAARNYFGVTGASCIFNYFRNRWISHNQTETRKNFMYFRKICIYVLYIQSLQVLQLFAILPLKIRRTNMQSQNLPRKILVI